VRRAESPGFAPPISPSAWRSLLPATGSWTTSTPRPTRWACWTWSAWSGRRNSRASAGVPIDKMLDAGATGALIGTVDPKPPRRGPAFGPARHIRGRRRRTVPGTGVDVLARSGRAYINLGTAVGLGKLFERYVFDAAFRTETAGRRSRLYRRDLLALPALPGRQMSREMLGIDPQESSRRLTALEANQCLAGRRQRRHARPYGGVHDPLLGIVGPGRDRRPLGSPGAAISIARCWRA